MDTLLQSVPGIVLEAGAFYSAFCSHISYLSADGYEFAPAPEIDYSKVGSIKASIDDDECQIKIIPADSGTFIGNLYDKIPYTQVTVKIYNIELDDDFEVTNAYCIWSGLLYSIKRWLNSRILDVIGREHKYYFDKTAGVVCSEQCTAAYFGDKVCGKTVGSTTGVVDSIDGSILTFTTIPTGEDYVYNNGYIEYEGVRIKITYWVSGDTFNMIYPPPASWVGKTVTIYQGCDRQIVSCRRLENEARFWGLGYSMVDYNALTEEV